MNGNLEKNKVKKPLNAEKQESNNNCIDCKGQINSEYFKLQCRNFLCINCIAKALISRIKAFECAFCSKNHHLNKFRVLQKRGTVITYKKNKERNCFEITENQAIQHEEENAIDNEVIMVMDDLIQNVEEQISMEKMRVIRELDGFNDLNNNSEEIINNHCSYMLDQIDISYESRVIEIDRLKENLHSRIDTYKENCIRKIEESNNDVDEYINEQLKNIRENNYTDDQLDRIRESIRRKKEQYNEEIIFNKNKLKLDVENRKAVNKSNVGKLKEKIISIKKIGFDTNRLLKHAEKYQIKEHVFKMIPIHSDCILARSTDKLFIMDKSYQNRKLVHDHCLRVCSNNDSIICFSNTDNAINNPTFFFYDYNFKLIKIKVLSLKLVFNIYASKSKLYVTTIEENDQISDDKSYKVS